MPYHLIDSHCHLDFTAFDHDRKQVVQQCQQAGIRQIIIPGVKQCNWPRQLAICSQYSQLHPALGLHPYFLEQHQPQHIVQLHDLVAQQRPVAIGEIGLDFLLPQLAKETQQKYFVEQLEIARQFNLPVIIHARKSHDQIIQCLRQFNLCGGIIHAFNGSLQQAQHYISLGFKLGFGGMLTYPRSTRLRQLAAKLPLTSLVLETDAPDMTVARHQGQRNSPYYLIDCLTALAKVRDQPAATIAAQTSSNCIQVLHLTTT